MYNHTLSPETTAALLRKARQEKFLNALLANPVVTAAAREAGISARTSHNYLADPDFQRAHHAARREASTRATAKLQSAVADAAKTLGALIDAPGTPATARVNAARAVLDHAVSGAEVEALSERIRILEARVEQLAAVRASAVRDDQMIGEAHAG